VLSWGRVVGSAVLAAAIVVAAIAPPAQAVDVAVQGGKQGAKPSASAMATTIRDRAATSFAYPRTTSAWNGRIAYAASARADWWVVGDGAGYRLGSASIGWENTSPYVMRYRDAVVAAMRSLGLTKIGETSSYGSIMSSFSNRDIVCSIDFGRYSSSAPMATLAFACSSASAVAARVAAATPFRNAFRVSRTTSGLAFDVPTVVHSSSSRYRAYLQGRVVVTGVAAHEGSVALFAKAPSGQWQYMLSTQSLVNCRTYESKATWSRAWAGTGCWRTDAGGGKMSTVRPH